MPTAIDEALDKIYSTHRTQVESARADFLAAADGADPRDLGDDCTKLGEVFHWKWGRLRVAWFWGTEGRIVLVEAWLKKGQRERRERVGRLNNIKSRFESEVNEYHDK